MSIQVVVSSTAAGVSVSGGTAVAITVGSVSSSVPVTVGGGIGPAGFIVNPGTASSAFGTFQLAAGDGITISTSVGQFQIASYGTTAVSSLAPVQSVAGRVGAVQLQASDVTAGTFAIARIPTISYTALANVPATFSPSAHTHSTSDVASFTAAAAAAAPVQSVAGRSGAISLTAADVSGLASVATSGSYTSLQNVPASFAPSAHTHSTADVVGLTASFSQVGHAHPYVQVLNGLTGTLSISGGAGVTVSTSSSSITIAAAGSYVLPEATESVLGGIRVGSGLSVASGVLSVSSSSIPSAPQSVTFQVTVTPSTDNVSWTAPVSGAVATYEVHRAANALLPYVRLGTTSSTTFSLTGFDRTGGDAYRVRALTSSNVAGEWGYTTGAPDSSSSNIVEAATAAGFPATGASRTIYIATDASRVFRWDTSGVYIELGN